MLLVMCIGLEVRFIIPQWCVVQECHRHKSCSVVDEIQ
jgi:hypothetical protein